FQAESSSDRLAAFQQEVEALVRFKDEYFAQQQEQQQRGGRSAAVEARVEQIASRYADVGASISGPDSRCAHALSMGKLYHCLEEFDQRALDNLTTAAKLKPDQPEAWRLLGETYWKRRDYQSAYNCFNSALQHGRDSAVLRNLSMVLRALPFASAADRLAKVEESLAKAKEALQMDIKDGRSWAVLGNAYLSCYFTKDQSSTSMRLAMSAYSNAMKDPVASSDPDLHYNSAMAHVYLDQYEQALSGFRMAHRLDPSWPQAQEKVTQLPRMLSSIQDIIDSRGRLKPRVYKSMMEGFAQRRVKDLGPYAGGGYSDSRGESVALAEVRLSQLKVGANPETVLLLRVIGLPRADDQVCLSVCAMDSDEACSLVNIFNISADRGLTVGDAMAIPEPTLSRLDFADSETGRKFQFPIVRVPSPDCLVVNGKKAKASAWRSATVFSSQVSSSST
uniref:TPR_REGION domain-containing protein n=1 Tax=Macrostomum lignano TaxID=282301 RepID=A0A1I8GV69_9PLAT